MRLQKSARAPPKYIRARVEGSLASSECQTPVLLTSRFLYDFFCEPEGGVGRDIDKTFFMESSTWRPQYLSWCASSQQHWSRVPSAIKVFPQGNVEASTKSQRGSTQIGNDLSIHSILQAFASTLPLGLLTSNGTHPSFSSHKHTLNKRKLLETSEAAGDTLSASRPVVFASLNTRGPSTLEYHQYFKAVSNLNSSLTVLHRASTRSYQLACEQEQVRLWPWEKHSELDLDNWDTWLLGSWNTVWACLAEWERSGVLFSDL